MAPSTAFAYNIREAEPLPLPSLSGMPLLDVLRLMRTPNVGPVTLFALLRRFGDPSEALARLPELAKRGGRKAPLNPCSVEQAEKEIAAVERFGARFIVYGDADYPPLLHMIPDPPPVLTLIGNASLWREKPVVGMVGARNASANGCSFAQKIAAELGQAGVTVVSGLARGIDTFAHKGALPHGTVAVIAGGIDTIYPPENAKLTQEIRACGAVISEQPFGMRPDAHAFPSRNRIIAGLSRSVIVVEAAPKSGSLITARLANEQGRDIFAVPGHPMDPRAQGCNRLIKNGATLVESAADVLEALNSFPRLQLRETAPAFAEPAPAETAEIHQALLDRLGPSPVLVDELLAQCQLTSGQLSAALMELELAGHISRLPGNRVCLNLAG